MSKRNTYKYELTKGNKVVYVGITNNPGRREAEHRQNKNFDKNENSRKCFYFRRCFSMGDK